MTKYSLLSIIDMFVFCLFIYLSIYLSMGLKDILDLMKIKNSGSLDELGVFDKEKKWLFSDIFKWKTEELENKVDILTEDTETSRKTAEILEWTTFKNKFNEIYGNKIEWQRKFEIFNRKISYVLKHYIDGMLPSYDNSICVELATGFQFVLMQKMSELWAKDSADFFAKFAWDKAGGLQWLVRGLFNWLNNSSWFVAIWQRLQNFLYFLDEYKGDLWNLDALKAWHIPNILLNDPKSSIWDSWSNIEWKSFDEIKTQIPVLSELDGNTEVADLKAIANNSTWSLNQRLLEVLSSDKGNGWALLFASKFLEFRPKFKAFLAKPIKLASRLFDNTFLWKQILGWKTVVEYLQDKHHGKTMNLVLWVIGFRGGRKGLNNYLEKDSKKKNIGKKVEKHEDDEHIVFTDTISNADYVAYGAHQIEKTESAKRYDVVNPYDVTWVSLWKLQWHDILAQKLMQFMQKQNTSEFDKTMWSDFVSLMNKWMKESWNIWRWPEKNASWWEDSPANRQKTHPAFLSNFKTLMAKAEFKKYMDLFMQQTVKDYLKLAKENWVEDPATAIYFARLCNRWPVKAKEFWNKSDKTLAWLHTVTQEERKSDPNDPLGKIYNPLFDDLQKTDFTAVNLDTIVA